MVMKKIAFGSTVASSDLNNNYNEALTLGGLNMVRELRDRSIQYGFGEMSGFADAYVDANGQMGTAMVDTANGTTATFTSNAYETTSSATSYIFHHIGFVGDGSTTVADKLFNASISEAIMVPLIKFWETGADIQYKFQYDEKSGVTGSTVEGASTGTFTDTANAFDDTESTFAYHHTTATDVFLGKTFSAKTVDYVYFRLKLSRNNPITLKLQSYNGSTWDDEASYAIGAGGDITVREHVYLGKSIQGLRLHASNIFYDGGTYFRGMEVYILSEGDITEETSYLNAGITPEISTFTALTNRPTKIVIKLEPKASSPTATYPAIYGFWLRAT